MILFIFLKKEKLFMFNEIFMIKILKIIFASILMGLFFYYLTQFFENQLSYNYQFKSFYLILSVLLGFVFYLLVSFLIKAFNYKDVQLKY